MLVFSHGCPNNAPRLLYKATRKWSPLFFGRSTVMTEFAEAAAAMTGDRSLSRLVTDAAHAQRLSQSYTSEVGRERLLVMAALKAGHRLRDRIAIATGLDLPNVEIAVRDLIVLGWVSTRNALTNEGHNNLRDAGPFKLHDRDARPIPPENRMYYPKLLRAPA